MAAPFAPGDLHAAIAAGNAAVVSILISARVDVDAPAPGHDQRPLPFALTLGRAEIVQQLVAAGADVNVDLGNAQTPLYLAVMVDSEKARERGRSADGSAEMTELLLAAGAVPTRATLALARHLGNDRALALMELAVPTRTADDVVASRDDSPFEPPPEPAPSTRPMPPFPGGVRAAGIIWAVLGIFILVVTAAGIVLSGWLRQQQERRAQANPGQVRTSQRAENPAQGCSTILGIGMGVYSLVVGLRTARGTARDTLVPGVLSILVGILYVGIGGLLMMSASMPAMIIAGMFGCVFGGVFLLASMLGLTGRTRYLAWREAARPGRLWRPSRT